MNIQNIRRLRKLFFIFTLFGFSITAVYANPFKKANKEKIELSGVVLDENNNPLPGVVIKIDGNLNGAITEPDGTFAITGRVYESSKLSFELLGYSTKVVQKGDAKQLKITLNSDVACADQQINLINEKRSRLGVTQAVATVTGDELLKTNHQNLGAALAGRLPGLIVRSADNEPGSETFTLNVRGTSTTNGRAPLVLIDGMVSPTFNHLNPNDVESVNIYKDAAAIALYGMQGGNGVISIITKRGEISKRNISVNVEYSFQHAIKTPNMLSSWQYATLENEAYENDGFGRNYMYSDSEIQAYKQGKDPKLYPNNNWYDMFMKPVVQTENVFLSANGGSKHFKYYTSMGYMHQDSPFKTDGTNAKTYGLHRFDVRSNVDVLINDYISGYMNISARIDHDTNPNSANNNTSQDILRSIFNMHPNIYGPLTPDNQVVVTPQNTNPTYGRINRSGYIRSLNSYLNANLGIKFDLNFITKGLTAQVGAKFYTNALSNIHGNTNYERWTRDLSRKDELQFIKYGQDENRPLSLSKGVAYSYMSEFDFQFDYQRQFGHHGLSAQFFGNYQYDNPAGGEIQPYVRMNYGMRASYSYKDLFFADMVTSVQGSDYFKKGHRFGAFPAFSAGLVLNNLDCLKEYKSVLSLLKLRGSYGLVGNDVIGNKRFLYKDNYLPVSGGFISSLGGKIANNGFANPSITWEKGRIGNIGLDMTLFNQISLSLDLFKESRKDILCENRTTPSSSGMPSQILPYINSGKITNKGLELSLGWQKNVTKDLFISLSGNVACNKNKINDINELYRGDDYASPYREKGYSIGQNWGYEIDYSNGNGFFNSLDDIKKSGLTYEGVAPRPGDFKYVDQNDDKMIDERDIVALGKTLTPTVSWGAALDLKWKGFDFSIMFQGLGGYGQFNRGLGFFETEQDGTYFENHLNAWTPERYAKGEAITSPALSQNTTASHVANNYYYQNKGFVRLKNLEIGYTLPYRWSKKAMCRNIRFFASGINLLTFDKMKSDDLDVEMSSLGVFPSSRYMTIGLNVTF